MAAKSGEPVSTSEAAKQLLESSKEERLEFERRAVNRTIHTLKNANSETPRRFIPLDFSVPFWHAE
jgi:hypothetical protein